MNWEKILKRKRRIIPPVKTPKKKEPQKFRYVSQATPKKEIHEKFRKKMHEKAKDFINEQFEYLLAKELQHWESNIASLKENPAGFEKEIKKQEKHIENLKTLTPKKLYSNALPLLNKEYDNFLDTSEEPHEYYSKFIYDVIKYDAFGEP